MFNQVASFKELTENIIKGNQCTRCGACIGLCPYLSLYHGSIVFPDACNLTDGRCISVCPKGDLDLDKLSLRTWNEKYQGTPLGLVLEILMARTTGSTSSEPQYGGIVSTLAKAAMTEKGISGTLLTRWRNVNYPEGIILQSTDEIFSFAGVHYAGAYTLAALNRYRKSHPHPVVVVGLPCQVLALRMMHDLDHPQNPHKNMGDFIIGLLCTWALSPRSFQKEMKRRFGNRKVLKYDIPPPPANRFEVFFENQQKVEIPLDEIRSLINPGCHTCLDMTSEFADVSVGAAEGFPGWNTVILRSKKGKILFDKLVGKGSGK